MALNESIYQASYIVKITGIIDSKTSLQRGCGIGFTAILLETKNSP